MLKKWERRKSRTEDSKTVRNRLICMACTIAWGHADSEPQWQSRDMCGTLSLPQMHLCWWLWLMLPPKAENMLLVCSPAWCCCVDVWRPYCHWAHIHLSVLVATPGTSDIVYRTLTDSHTCQGLISVKVCIDICAWVTSGDSGKSEPC